MDWCTSNTEMDMDMDVFETSRVCRGAHTWTALSGAPWYMKTKFGGASSTSTRIYGIKISISNRIVNDVIRS